MKKVTIKLNRKQLILLFTNIILMTGYLLLTFFAKNAVNGLYSQQEAQRWEIKKKPYAQVSAFISKEKDMQEEEISGVRSSLMEKLSNDSYNDAEKNARVWIDAYSGECDTFIRKDTNTLNITAVGVGGEFFQFHPVSLKSGGYLSEADVNHDRILIDDGLAWALFGSNDVVGMQVWLADSIYVVAGVVETEDDDLSKMTYGNVNRIYMYYDELKKKVPELKVTCYEAVLPNPISNYGYYALREAFGLESVAENTADKESNPLCFDDVEIVENSNRYELMPLLKKAKNLKLRSVRTNGVEYPYWENVAGVKEEEQIYYLMARLLLLVFPFLSLIWLIHHLWKWRSWSVKGLLISLKEKLQDKIEEKQQKKLQNKMKENVEVNQDELWEISQDEFQENSEDELQDEFQENSEDELQDEF